MGRSSLLVMDSTNRMQRALRQWLGAAACDFGLQYEEINEGVVGTAVSSGNELIRFMRPMRRMSRGDEKRDGIAGQKRTMLRKIAYFFQMNAELALVNTANRD